MNMKKRFLIYLATLIIAFAFAVPRPASSDTDDKFSIDGWRINSDQTLIPATTSSTKIVVEKYTSINTNNTLATTETGHVIADYGGTTTNRYCSKHILPRAANGLIFTVTAAGVCSVTVDTVDTSDTIIKSISGTKLDAGDSLKSTGQSGDYLMVCGTAANEWSVCGQFGAWTDNGSN